MDKVQIDGKQLIALLQHSRRVGTEHAAIDLAIEWISSAEKEVARLREGLLHCKALAENRTDGFETRCLEVANEVDYVLKQGIYQEGWPDGI